MPDDLSGRRPRRILQGSRTKSPRRHTRCRSIPTIRTTQDLGRYVFFPFLYSGFQTLTSFTATDDGTPLSSRTILACSASSKMVASCVTYPHEVLRTRLQVHRTQHAKAATPSAAPLSGVAPPPSVVEPIPRSPPKGLIDEAKFILKNSGIKGFYRGLSINLVRTVPSNAVTMLT
jgi:solute carrier family 25 folate transporter 32